MAKLVFTLPEWESAQRIALYHSCDGEIGTDVIAQRCHAKGVQVFLPVMGPDRSIVFSQWSPNDKLVRNSFGIFEPAMGAPLCPATDLDIIFLPLVGWDRSGGRLGMGAGYYDRVLADITAPLLVGLGHAIQEVDKVPLDVWDITLDYIITDTAAYHCQK